MTKDRETGEDIKALFLYVLLVAIMHGPVVFSGATLQPPLYQPSGIVEGWPYGYSGRTPVNSFNIDLATPAYYEWPVNKLVGDIYKNYEVPLWNPYQGAGEPLLAQYSTKALFPYQVIEDISPVWLWDFFLLGRVLIAGFFTYLFLRLSGVGFASAFFGGFLYMFSGAFTWFLNLEQYSNTAMMLPIFIWSLERLLKNGLRSAVAIASLSFGLTILAGQPETALYVLALGASWFLFRTLKDKKTVSPLRRVKQFVAFTLIGLAVAMPLILPFLEFERQAHHIHPAGNGLSTDRLPGLTNLISIVTPTAHEYRQEPELLYSLPLADGKTPDKKNFYFRASPLNGVWDFIGGYTGIIPLFLGLAGLLTVSFTEQRRFRHAIAFFFFAGTAILLKNIGIRPFVWIGDLPLFDMVWTQRWAGPIWIFCFAVAGAFAFEVFAKTPESAEATASSKKKVLSCILAAFMMIAATYALFVPFVLFKFNSSYADFASTFAPSLTAGIALTGGVLLFSYVVCAMHVKRARGIMAVVALSAIELWWAIPRGYGYPAIYLKVVPLSFGALTAIAVFTGRVRLAVALSALFFISFILADGGARNGLPDRFDPFSEPPYVGFIKSQDGYPRTIGSRGVLFPNYASATGLQDVRFINSMSIDCFNTYLITRLNNGWDKHTFSLWFTGLPLRAGSKAPYPAEVEDEIIDNLPSYSLLGVRYIVTPKGDKPNAFDGAIRSFKLVYDREVKVYENMTALPRVFTVTDVVSAPSCAVAQDMTGKPGFNAVRSAVIEGSAPSWFTAGQKARSSSARITTYGTNAVTIEAEADRSALLVLTDVYYPGWDAYIDGRPAEVYRVDGLLRGVFIEKGVHTIEFRYLPWSFLSGASIGVAAIFLCAYLFFQPTRPSNQGNSD